MNFLNDIVKYKEKIIADNIDNLKKIKKEVSAGKTTGNNRFLDNLKGPGLSVIAEVKLASPSEGKISNFSVEELAGFYEEARADCVSVLTEDKYFKGNLENIKRVKKKYTGPVLMKDFIVSEYQIYQASHLGAEAILLIKALLGKTQVIKFVKLARELGLYSLVEIHPSDDISKILELTEKEDVEIIGVNNRNLDTLKINYSNHKNMIKMLPPGPLKIAESGIKTKSQAKKVYKTGYDGILIGKGAIANSNPVKFIKELRAVC
ncbi:MAG: indole-3-glycerol phosphate synthase TrpC [Elusimicrobiota bacterium]